MKKQTAVEYLFNELFIESEITGKYVFRDYKLVEYYLDRAKEIEKKDIIDAYIAGDGGYIPDDGTIERMAQEYYKNNFEQ